MAVQNCEGIKVKRCCCYCRCCFWKWTFISQLALSPCVRATVENKSVSVELSHTFHGHFLLHHWPQHLRRGLIPRVCAQIHYADVSHFTHGRIVVAAPVSCSPRDSTGLHRDTPMQDVVAKLSKVHDDGLTPCDSVWRSFCYHSGCVLPIIREEVQGLKGAVFISALRVCFCSASCANNQRQCHSLLRQELVSRATLRMGEVFAHARRMVF